MSTVTLDWALPTTRTDGTPLPAASIKQVNVTQGAAPPLATLATLPGNATTFTTGVLTPGTYVFNVSVTDTDGNVSVPESISAVVPVPAEAPPNGVSGLTATVNP